MGYRSAQRTPFLYFYFLVQVFWKILFLYERSIQCVPWLVFKLIQRREPFAERHRAVQCRTRTGDDEFVHFWFTPDFRHWLSGILICCLLDFITESLWMNEKSCMCIWVWILCEKQLNIGERIRHGCLLRNNDLRKRRECSSISPETRDWMASSYRGSKWIESENS